MGARNCDPNSEELLNKSVGGGEIQTKFYLTGPRASISLSYFQVGRGRLHLFSRKESVFMCSETFCYIPTVVNHKLLHLNGRRGWQSV